MRPLLPLLALTLALCACQSRPVDNAAVSAAVPSGAEDTCQAQTYAWLIGQDRKQAPPAPEGKVIRVVCATCPMTMDYNAERLNVIFDAKTGRISALRCG